MPVEALLCANPAIIYILHLTAGQWVPVYVSSGVEERLGYAPEAVIGNPDWWRQRVHPEDLDRVVAGMSLLVEQGRLEHEYRFQTAQDKYIWVRDTLNLVRDSQGRPEWVTGTWLDVSEYRLSERRIQALNRTLRLISDCSQSMIRATSIQGLLSTVCQQLIETGGYRLAWAGLVDEQALEHRLRPTAWAGMEAGYLSAWSATWR